MTLIQSKYAKGIVAIAYPSIAAAVSAMRFAHSVTTALAVGDIIELGVIPAGTRVVDIIIDSDDLDANGAPTLSLDVGIMSGAFGDEDPARTCGNQFFAGTTVSRASGIERASKVSAFRTTVTGNDRSIGVKCTAVAATFAAGEVGITVLLATE